MIRLQLVQALPTSGARAAETFMHAGTRWLVVPQLAEDIPGQAADMTLGNSDTAAPVFRWHGGRFVPHASLPVPGGEDAAFFRIGDRAFLATATLRSGSGPYAMDAQSTIFEWQDGGFVPFQQIATQAAKQWLPFTVDGRQFLALAQGASHSEAEATDAARSIIFEWDGERFAPFQVVRSAWGYNWAFFGAGGERLLAYADHVAPSVLLRWTGERFEEFQVLEGAGGRAFRCFQAQGTLWLAFARLLGETAIYRWQDGRFVQHQVLSGPGGREFAWLPGLEGGRLLQVNFIRGTRAAPIAALHSVFWKLEHGQWLSDLEFPTSGATDAAVFEEGGVQYLLVSESLSAEVRFGTPSRLYRIEMT